MEVIILINLNRFPMNNKFLLLFFLLVTGTIVVAQNRYYVHPTAQGSNTGLSWQDAFTDLQIALAASEAGDEIWITQGQYKPTTTIDRTVSFQPKSGVKLYGGFAGNEVVLENRNWQLHPTILSGDIGTEGDSADNSLNIVYLFEPDSNTVIDGLIIQDGNASNGGGQSFSYQRQFNGGGLYIMGYNGDAYALIQNCLFRRNTAQANGGGIMIYSGGVGSNNNVQVKNCTFEQNRALFYGGGLFRIGGGQIDQKANVAYCRFTKNTALVGGGMAYLDNKGTDMIAIRCCRFEENAAINWGGGLYMSPERNSATEVLIDSCHFAGNKAKFGAALDVFPINTIFFKGNIVLKRSTFTENESLSLTGEPVVRIIVLGDDASAIMVDSCSFKENKALSPGVPVVVLNSASGNLQFSNSLIDDDNLLLQIADFSNAVIINSIFFRGNKLTSAITDGSSYFLMKNSIIIDKDLTLPGKAPIGRLDHPQIIENCFFKIVTSPYVFGGGSISNPAVPCTNSIFFEGLLSASFQSTDKHILTNCYVSNIDCSNPPDDITCINSITGIDPLLVNPGGNDYRLQPCSPLINSGINAVIQPGDTDLDGNDRIRGGTVDIGPYESAPLGLAVEPETTGACPGGNSGAVAFTPTSACEPVQFYWSGPAGVTGTDLDQLAAGNYIITITDAKKDTLIAVFTIPEGTPPHVNAQLTPVICGTTTGGTAQLNGSNGSAPFSFNWGNGVMDSIRTGLAYGIYPVTITDANGCTASANIQIERMGNIQAQITQNEISCYGESDGAIHVQPTNGASPYSWNWEYNGSTDPGLSGLPSGSYTGTLIDALECAFSWIIPLENPDSITTNVEVTSATGPLQADGSIILVPSGGTGNFTAAWNNGATGLTINSLLPGFYTATVTDENGCTQKITLEMPWSSGTAEVLVAPVQVWPNPATNWLSVQPQSLTTPFTFTLTDPQGRVLRSFHREDASTFLVPVSELPVGVYAWRINSKDGQAGGVVIRMK